VVSCTAALRSSHYLYYWFIYYLGIMRARFLRNAHDHLLVYGLFSMSDRGWASSNQGSKCYHDKRVGGVRNI